MSPDDPVTDDFIEVDGKTYYLDAKGYMKTGWVTDKSSGNRYYMGQDGAMYRNAFTPDDRYVGPEGTEITDGYRDLVVTDALENGGSILKIAVWDTGEEKLQLSAEFDVPGSGDRNTLYLDPEGEGVWLEIVRSGSDISLFQMKYDSSMFESIWEFKMETDDWGGPVYYANDSEEDRYYWETLMNQAMEKRGNTPLTGYLPATDENIKSQLDLVLSEEELRMWWE